MGTPSVREVRIRREANSLRLFFRREKGPSHAATLKYHETQFRRGSSNIPYLRIDKENRLLVEEEVLFCRDRRYQSSKSLTRFISKDEINRSTSRETRVISDVAEHRSMDLSPFFYPSKRSFQSSPPLLLLPTGESEKFDLSRDRDGIDTDSPPGNEILGRGWAEKRKNMTWSEIVRRFFPGEKKARGDFCEGGGG